MRYIVISVAFDILAGDRPELPPESWKTLAEAFDVGHLESGFVRAVEFERAVGIDVVETQGGGLAEIRQLSQKNPASVDTFVKRAGTYHVRLMNEYVDVARLPVYEAKDHYRRTVKELEDKAPKDPLDVALSVLLVPALDRFHESLAATRARVRIARAVCKIKAEGKIPETLEVEDPFTGNPMVYLREAKGFHLYSLGPNGADDGGEGEDAGYPKDDIGIRVKK